MEFDELSKDIIGCAIEVHKQLGPGLLESAYERCLCHELRLNNIELKQQVMIPVNYRGIKLDCGYRIDLLVANSIIVELKAVEQMNKIYEAQLLTYMKLANKKTGLLINFNVDAVRKGIRRLTLKASE